MYKHLIMFNHKHQDFARGWLSWDGRLLVPFLKLIQLSDFKDGNRKQYLIFTI